MALVVLTTSYPRFPDDTAGRIVAASVAALRRSGARVEVIAPADGAAAAWTSGAVALRYAPLSRLQTLCYGAGIVPNLKAQPLRGLLVPGLVGALWRATRRRRLQPIIAHWLVPAALAAVLAGAKRVVAVVHGSDVALLERSPGGQALARALAARCLGIGCVSAELAQRFAALIDDPAPNVTVLPPICEQVTPIERARARRAIGLSSTQLCALFVGRLLATKGVATLIDAIAALPKPVLLLVAGDGPQRSQLEQQARARGVAARFFGTVRPQQRDCLLAAADVVVVPSRPDAHGHAEGLPAVLLEAMAAGRPVIASAVGGVPDVVADGDNGWLVPPADVAALTSALQRAFDDPALRARTGRAAQRAASTWTPACHAAALRALFGGDTRSV